MAGQSQGSGSKSQSKIRLTINIAKASKIVLSSYYPSLRVTKLKLRLLNTEMFGIVGLDSLETN